MLETSYVVLVLGASLLAGERPGRRAALALVLLGIGTAALRAGGPAASAPGGFLRGTAGLLLPGLVLAGWAAQEAGGKVRWVLLAAVTIGLAGAWPVVLGAGIGAAAGAAGVVMAALLVLGIGGRRLAVAGRSRPLASRLLRPPAAIDLRAATRRPHLSALAALGAFGVVLGPHLAAVFLGAAALAVAGHLAARPTGGRRVPVLPVLTLLLLPVYWLMATIAGPVGLSIARLGQVPLSTAAQVLLAPGLLLVVWGFLGLWPLHRLVPGVSLAPFGALLLVRVGLPALPAGIEHWQPALFPLGVLAVWHGALVGAGPLAATAGAALGIVSLAPAGIHGAGWLLAGAAALLIAPQLGAERGRPFRIGGVVLAGWGGLLALEGGLGAEVDYSTVAALGAGAAALRAAADSPAS